jgi:hypothetical protein
VLCFVSSGWRPAWVGITIQMKITMVRPAPPRPGPLRSSPDLQPSHCDNQSNSRPCGSSAKLTLPVRDASFPRFFPSPTFRDNRLVSSTRTTSNGRGREFPAGISPRPQPMREVNRLNQIEDPPDSGINTGRPLLRLPASRQIDFVGLRLNLFSNFRSLDRGRSGKLQPTSSMQITINFSTTAKSHAGYLARAGDAPPANTVTWCLPSQSPQGQRETASRCQAPPADDHVGGFQSPAVISKGPLLFSSRVKTKQV